MEDVKKAKQTYKEYRGGKEGYSYTVDRDFFHRSLDRKGLSVLKNLPSHNDEDARQLIERKIKKGSIKVLDLGSGQGVALKDIQQKYLGKVKITGLTAHIYEPLQIPQEQQVVGDVVDIKKVFPPNSFDVIYSVATLVHVKRHFLDIVRQTYSVLNEDGVGLLQVKKFSDKFNRIRGLDRLRGWLKQNGYDFEFDARLEEEDQNVHMVENVSFRKTNKYLRLPISYAKEDGYKFDESKAKRLGEIINS